MERLKPASIRKSITEIRDETHIEISISTVLIFLEVALAHPGGVSNRELSELTGLSTSAVSRQIDMLSNVQCRNGAPGFRLVRCHYAPHDGRVRVSTLTEKGIELLGRM